MSPRWPLTVLLLLLAGSLCAVGCGSRKDPAIALLERENRALEDLIWRWKDAYDEKCQDLDACRRAYESQKRLDDADELPNPTMQPRPATPRPAAPRPAAASPTSQKKPRPAKPADPLAIPLIEGPSEGAADPSGPSLDRTTHRGGLRPAAAEEEIEQDATPKVVRAGGEQPVQAPGEVDAEVSHIVLNPRLTGGFDFDKSKSGDEGVMVVIEPRNADGAYVPLSGEVTVVLLDPAEEGEAQRFARFDFDAIEAARHLRKSLFGKGIHLELRWPDQPPAHDLVRIAVRYTTADGRKVEARRDVNIALPAGANGRWTPVGGTPGAPSPRHEPAESSPATHVTEPRTTQPATPGEPGLLQLPTPSRAQWKAVEGG